VRYAVFSVGHRRDERAGLVGLAFCFPDAAAMAQRRAAAGETVYLRSIAPHQAQRLAEMDIVSPWVLEEHLPGESMPWMELCRELQEVRP
jgi:hypothetical protein